MLDLRRGDGSRTRRPARGPVHRRDRAGARRSRATSPRRSRHRARRRRRRASPRPTWSSSASYRTADGAPGLHRAARLRRARGTPTASASVWCARRAHFMVRAMRAERAGHRRRAISSVIADRDRRRLRRQDHGLPGAGRAGCCRASPAARCKMVMTREEVFRPPARPRARRSRVKIGARSATARITAAEAWLTYEAGAFPGSPVAPGAMTCSAATTSPNVRIDGYDVVVNKPKVAAYRAPGAPQAALRGRVRDRRAGREAGHRPDRAAAEERRAGGHAARSTAPTFRAIGLRRMPARRRRRIRTTRRRCGPNQGRGVAAGFWFNVGVQSSAAVHVNEDGSVPLVEGTPDIGGSRAVDGDDGGRDARHALASVQPTVVDTDPASASPTSPAAAAPPSPPAGGGRGLRAT